MRRFVPLSLLLTASCTQILGFDHDWGYAGGSGGQGGDGGEGATLVLGCSQTDPIPLTDIHATSLAIAWSEEGEGPMIAWSDGAGVSFADEQGVLGTGLAGAGYSGLDLWVASSGAYMAVGLFFDGMDTHVVMTDVLTGQFSGELATVPNLQVSDPHVGPALGPSGRILARAAGVAGTLGCETLEDPGAASCDYAILGGVLDAEDVIAFAAGIPFRLTEEGLVAADDDTWSVPDETFLALAGADATPIGADGPVDGRIAVVGDPGLSLLRVDLETKSLVAEALPPDLPPGVLHPSVALVSDCAGCAADLVLAWEKPEGGIQLVRRSGDGLAWSQVIDLGDDGILPRVALRRDPNDPGAPAQAWVAFLATAPDGSGDRVPVMARIDCDPTG